MELFIVEHFEISTATQVVVQAQTDVSDSFALLQLSDVFKSVHFTSTQAAPTEAPSVHLDDFLAQAPSAVVVISEQAEKAAHVSVFQTQLLKALQAASVLYDVQS